MCTGKWRRRIPRELLGSINVLDIGGPIVPEIQLVQAHCTLHMPMADDRPNPHEGGGGGCGHGQRAVVGIPANVRIVAALRRGGNSQLFTRRFDATNGVTKQ